MPDERKWRLTLPRLRAFRDNLPLSIGESVVPEYHAILEALAEASGENLDEYRIPAEMLKPRITGAQIGTRRAPGMTFYSKDKYCDKTYMLRKMEALVQSLSVIEEALGAPKPPTNPNDYWSMTNDQLEALAARYRIGGYGDAQGIDREIIIKALRERDRALNAKGESAAHSIYIENMHGSSIQVASPGANATVTYSIADQRELLESVKAAVRELSLNGPDRTTLATDLATIEVQLNSGSPKLSIVRECWISARDILQKITGSLIASGLAYEIGKHLGH